MRSAGELSEKFIFQSLAQVGKEGRAQLLSLDLLLMGYAQLCNLAF